ncbi:hypothetical protein PFISCL1PPCAC_20569, partial [Pristionchus fissidentatus]
SICGKISCFLAFKSVHWLLSFKKLPTTMSDTLVQVPAGDTKGDQSETINVDTTQSSLLKKGGLFGKSVAMSPRVGDGTSSPVDDEIENGNEEASSPSKNGGSNANGDHQDESDDSGANGDSGEEPIEEEEKMAVDEPTPAADADESLADEPKEPETTAATEDEPEEAEIRMEEDIQMEDDIDEEDPEDETEPAKKEDEVVAEEKKDKEPEKVEEAEEKKEEDSEDVVEAEEKEEVEEECVKKIISMDTDETVEETEETTEKVEEESEAVDATQEEDKKEEEETPEVPTPVKKGRGRPPKSASSTPLQKKKVEMSEESEASPKRTPRGAAKKATEAMASPVSTKGRGRRSLKSETSSHATDDVEEKEEVTEKGEEEADEAEITKTPTGRGRRSSVKSTPAAATRGTPRGRKPKQEEEEKEEKEEEEEKKDDDEEAEEKVEESPKRGRRSTVSTPVAKKETPARGARSAKKDNEDEETPVSPSRRSTRGSPTKTTPSPSKGRGRKSSVKSEETVEEEEEVEESEEVFEKKGRGRGRKSVTKTPTASSAKKSKKSEAGDDPFDLDTELDKHPEPLRNITVEKGSFGEMKYTRTPSSSVSKYAATEKSASDKVANLPNTPAATGTPKTIASAQSTRKSLGGSPVKRTPVARKKKEEDDEGEGDEEMEVDEEKESTPVEKKGRGRPAGSAGRKRKAEDTPLTPLMTKRAAATVTVPVLDAEKQWAADHPEDDSAPLIPGARVYAVFQKVFYPALVGERDGLGRYLVEFVEDKIVRPIPPAGVVPLSAVTIDKECLYQESASSDVFECRVLKSANAANAKEWQQGLFKIMEVENEDNEHEVDWSKLQLDMATPEWRKYVNTKSKNASKVITDNITSLEDRRERRSRVHNDTAVAVAALRGTPEPTNRRSIGRKTPATAKATPKAPSTGGRRGRKPKAAAVEAEPEAKAEKDEDEEGVQKEDEEVDTEEAEDAKPAMNPRIFLNKTFILTSANRVQGEIIFKKNEMKKQILERGGQVVDDINVVALDADAFLISDTHYRTHKYLAAMSRGMPCVSHVWVVECVKREEFVPFDEYKLSGGQGLLNGKLYPLPDVRGKLLVGRSIMVHSKTDGSTKKGTMSFKQIWAPIVELLGATIVPDDCLVAAEESAELVVPDTFEILLTDSSCPPEAVQKIEEAGKAVVSSEWLIQSIIMGSCPDFTAHPRFRYDSGNEPAKKEGSQEDPQGN